MTVVALDGDQELWNRSPKLTVARGRRRRRPAGATRSGVSDRLSIRFTARAVRQVEQAGGVGAEPPEGARRHSLEELDRALENTGSSARCRREAGSAALGSVGRVHLGRINYHLYYRIRGTPPDGIELLAFWHGSRGAPPSL